eukprot:TRINITY_DN80882_c0_g1_i1.p1 TRINITY_DN80882_c0_g1~~TRINITY_DN80882_c0_g1_i1.p1  ORF type:complete len:356 (+),score=71.90 TRINITY_DN80882_c0_g1_i1:121-1188(+)
MAPKPPKEVGGFKLGGTLGSGSFGEVYHGRRGDQEVAIKLECTSSGSRGAKKPHLLDEAKFLQSLDGCHGVPKVFFHGPLRKFNALVMELLGPSLDDHFQTCGKRFSTWTVLMCMAQMIERLHHVHKRGIVHRDIKPQNFLTGRGPDADKIYLVDFGLSKTYLDGKTGKHVGFKDGRKGLVGTARYTSISNHLGIEPTRRDDLEGLGYVGLHMAKGALPWQQHLKDETKQERNARIKAAKLCIPIEQLCQGMPAEYAEYMKIVRGLGFAEEPPYAKLRELMETAARRLRDESDDEMSYDWLAPTLSDDSSDYSQSSEEESTSSTLASSEEDGRRRKRRKDRKEDSNASSGKKRRY